MTSQLDRVISAKRGIKPGQLKLSIQVVDHILSVHIIEARRLKLASESSTCNAYCQVSLLPSAPDTDWTSQTVREASNPVFDEIYNKQVLLGDEQKRLWVSLWHQDSDMSEFLGCMSFGMKHLVGKSKKKSQVHGWYHLLSENLGHRKHLLAQDCSPPSSGNTSTPARQTEIKGQGQIKEHPKTRSSTPNGRVKKSSGVSTALTIVVPRSGSGYGFTVKNTRPVRVGRVKPQGPSARAGLQRGDSILLINGQDVRTESATTVANIVRLSVTTLVLEVQRETKCRGTCSAALAKHTTAPETSKHTGSGLTCADSDEEIENIPPTDDSGCMMIEAQSHKESSYSLSRVENQSQASHMTWDPDISIITTDESLQNRHVISQCSDVMSVCSSSVAESSRMTGVSDYGLYLSGVGSSSGVSSTSGVSSRIGSSVSNVDSKSYSALSGQNLGVSCQSVDSGRSITRSTIDTTGLSTNSVNNWSRHSSQTAASRRHAAVRALARCERDFVRGMQRGIQQFSRPLRHGVLSAEQHQRLFQNIEKLVALSEYHVRQLTTSDALSAGQRRHHDYEDDDISYASDVSSNTQSDDVSVGDAYRPRINLLCGAYKSYLEGLPQAISLLYDLHKNAKFLDFMKTTQTSGTMLADFLEAPPRHLSALIRDIPRVLAVTSHSHEDWNAVYEVVKALTGHFQQ